MRESRYCAVFVAGGARCTLTSVRCFQTFGPHDVVVRSGSHLTLSSATFRGRPRPPNDLDTRESEDDPYSDSPPPVTYFEDRVAVCFEWGADAVISGGNDFGREYEWNVRFDGEMARSVKNAHSSCGCPWCSMPA